MIIETFLSVAKGVLLIADVHDFYFDCILEKIMNNQKLSHNVLVCKIYKNAGWSVKKGFCSKL